MLSNARPTWPVDDGGAAHTPETGETVYDDISRQWTRALPAGKDLELRARIKILEAELAKYRAHPAPIKCSIPLRALCFHRQDIGLRVPF